MKNPVLKEIIEFAQRRLSQAYGFVGVASGDTCAVLNSTDRDGNDIIIKIDVKPE